MKSKTPEDLLHYLSAFKRPKITKTAQFDKMSRSRYSYACKIAKVVDGDTIDVDIDLGLDQ